MKTSLLIAVVLLTVRPVLSCRVLDTVPKKTTKWAGEGTSHCRLLFSPGNACSQWVLPFPEEESYLYIVRMSLTSLCFVTSKCPFASFVVLQSGGWKALPDINSSLKLSLGAAAPSSPVLSFLQNTVQKILDWHSKSCLIWPQPVSTCSLLHTVTHWRL